MRCGCPNCDSFMIHSERDNACVCPTCLYRCSACQGAGLPLSREQAKALKGEIPDAPEANAPQADAPSESQNLR